MRVLQNILQTHVFNIFCRLNKKIVKKNLYLFDKKIFFRKEFPAPRSKINDCLE